MFRSVRDTHWWDSRATAMEMVLMLVLMTTFATGGYYLVEGLAANALNTGGNPHWPAMSLDDHAPFIPAFIWPYLAYYPLVALSVLVGLHSRVAMHRLAFGYALTSIFAWTLFALMPSRMVQADLSGCEQYACLVVARLYAVDAGFNVFPSLHVAHSVLVWRFLVYTRLPLRHVAAFMVFTIAASTVLIKQHYLIDVPAGVAFGLLTATIAQADIRNLAPQLSHAHMLFAERSRKLGESPRGASTLRHLSASRLRRTARPPHSSSGSHSHRA